MKSDVYEEFLKLNTRVADQMLAKGFEQAKEAYAAFGIPFKHKTVEEYCDWLAQQYPMPVPDWM
jgi:hypothetical protein